MNLMALSVEADRVTGNGLGFVIRSLKHAERKFLVGYKSPITGKFIITRLDTKEDFVVDGTSDRYEFVVPMAKLAEAKKEIAELCEQQKAITNRLTELQTEIGELSGGGLSDVG